MKKLIISSVLLCASYSAMWSQMRVDIKLGISPASSPVNAGVLINRDNPRSEFMLNMVHVKPQFSAGINLHQRLNESFFVEGGFAYTKKTSQFRVNYTLPQSEPLSSEMFMNESEDIIQLPVNIGVGLGKIDVTSGLTALKTISSKNELAHIEGFSAEDNSLRYGWQMGVRYAFMHRASAGVEYQSTMTRVCQGMKVNGHALDLMNVPGRIVFNLQYRF
ncbi:MAG: outer membrane beta-barrel protein [Saprospiraceae bacterium]